MKLPPIPRPVMVVCHLNPRKELGDDAYSALGLDTLAAVLHAMQVLESEPFCLRTEYIGLFEHRLTPMIARVDGPHWLVREACDECLEVTSPCEQEVVAALTAAGHHFEPSHVRFAQSLPPEWEPEDTMRHVGLGHMLLGSVPEPESCGVALPFEPTPGLIPGVKGWAAWVAVITDHLGAA